MVQGIRRRERCIAGLPAQWLRNRICFKIWQTLRPFQVWIRATWCGRVTHYPQSLCTNITGTLRVEWLGATGGYPD